MLKCQLKVYLNCVKRNLIFLGVFLSFSFLQSMATIFCKQKKYFFHCYIFFFFLYFIERSFFLIIFEIHIAIIL